MRWRWDQGRLNYFKFDNIIAIAKVLWSLDGVDLAIGEDVLRQPLEAATGLPFAPSHYKVWRNYARVFHCSMLATSVSSRLVITDLCRKMAEAPDGVVADEYLNFVFSHFALPFPAFTDYQNMDEPSFPFVAIVKYLIANLERGCSVDEVFSCIIGNDCKGTEPLEFYESLQPAVRNPHGDEKRQVREMLVFMGQSSYLKWFDSRLYLDSLDFKSILGAVAPSVREARKTDPNEEFLALTSLGQMVPSTFNIILEDRMVSDFSVQEGGKKFISHGKIERSPLVRKKYFLLYPEIVCDACYLHPQERYPWTHNILELHHILPLAATLNINGVTTTLDDLKPLCPSCHKSIHLFYKTKLLELDVADFGSKQMAEDVYRMAKGAICQ